MARPRSDIQPRVVRAARTRFLTDGVDGASLRTIAKSARTSIGMVFYYFPTKDDLFFAVVEEVYGALLRDVEAILGDAGPVPERVRRLSLRIGTMTEEELQVVRLVVREALLSSTRLRRLLARFERGHIPMVLGALSDGVARGEIEPGLPLPVLLLCTIGMAAVPQIARRVTAGSQGFAAALPAADVLAGFVAKALFEGIGPTARKGERRRTRARKRSILAPP